MAGQPSQLSLPPLTRDNTVVIVGAGIAGLRCALTLRQDGFDGSIKLIGEEKHPPYDRPPLSKGVLTNSDGEKSIALDPEGELEAQGVEFIAPARCVEVNRVERTVVLNSGTAICFDRLVLATGSQVRTLPIFPAQSPGVHYLRTLDDALGLRAALSVPRRVGVIGAGVIGLEVAASLRQKGHSVVVVDPALRVMGRSSSPKLGEFLRARHETEGVEFRLGASICSAERAGEEFKLSLTDGTQLIVNEVVVGVGVAPDCGLAKRCGLEATDLGVTADTLGRTSDPSIWAAGEVAYHHNAALGRHDRQETWAHAAAHGAHVAHALMGVEDGYREIASYWTDQYDVNIQVVGNPITETDVVRGELNQGNGLIFHISGGRIEGVSAVNSVRQLRAARKLIGRSIDPCKLADTGQDLKELAG